MISACCTTDKTEETLRVDGVSDTVTCGQNHVPRRWAESLPPAPETVTLSGNRGSQIKSSSSEVIPE